MGELAIQNLHGNGASKVTVINRTFEKAEKLAERFSGEARSIDEWKMPLLKWIY